jgi:2-keto-4-pentenoate hydratase/2-oxohepta-3-ene-1,7-dioic acid hydratase in catechol pathway
MRYCRFESDEGLFYGKVDSVGGQDCVVAILPPPTETLDIRHREIDPLPLEKVRLLAPVRPSKIVCVGRNYREHASELGNEVPKEPLIFLKPQSSLLAPEEAIRIPKFSERVDFEGELGIVIGKVCRRLEDKESVADYIRGFTCVNDVTARDLQKKDAQWTRAKGFDSFCPVGPIVTDEIDPDVGVKLETRLNGELRQSANTREVMFNADAIIRYISHIMTLFPGDLISTGTPEGVGPMKPGDIVEVSIAGVGTLRNKVIAD